MTERPIRSILAPTVALVWCVAVAAAYYVFNYSYYQQKIAVFARFLIRFMS